MFIQGVYTSQAHSLLSFNHYARIETKTKTQHPPYEDACASCWRPLGFGKTEWERELQKSKTKQKMLF